MVMGVAWADVLSSNTHASGLSIARTRRGELGIVRLAPKWWARFVCISPGAGDVTT